MGASLFLAAALLLHPPAVASARSHGLRHKASAKSFNGASRDLVQYKEGGARLEPISPCQLPGIESDNFVPDCTTYFQNGFVCMKSATTLVSKSTIGRVEDVVKGQLSYCSYDTIRRRVQTLPIGDDILIAAERRRQRKADEEERRKKESGIQGHPPGTKDRPPKLSSLLRPMARRFRISISVMDRYRGRPPFRDDADWLQTQAAQLGEECRTQDAAALVNVTKASEYERLVHLIYAQEAKALWSFGDCETDMAIVVLGTPAGDENRLNPTLTVALSAHASTILGPAIRRLEADVNRDRHLPTAGAKLRRFFEAFLPLYKEHWPAFPGRKQHRIPPWAVWAFVASGLISLVATLLGNFVTTKRKRTSATASIGKKPAGRQWGAGFSGGMWKST